MRTKRRCNRFEYDTRNINYATIRTMIALLQNERHQHRLKVAELKAILDIERSEINAFLKDMQKILADLEGQRPPNDTFSPFAWNIQHRNVRILSIPIEMGPFSINCFLFYRCTIAAIG